MKPPFLQTATVLTLLTLSSFSALHAAEPLVASFPEDSILFLNATSLTKLRLLKDHPLAKTLRSGELGKALAPVFDNLSGQADAATGAILKEETGLNLEELLAKFPGVAAASVSLSINKMMEQEAKKPDAETVGFVFAADFTGDEALMAKIVSALNKIGEKSKADRQAKAKAQTDKVKEADAEADPEADPDADADEDPAAVADTDPETSAAADEKESPDWPEDYEETVTEVAGAKVHEWNVSDLDKNEADKMSWSIANGKAVFSLGKTDLKEVVSHLIKPVTEGSLAASPAWKTLPATAQEADVLVGLNLEHALGDVQEGLRLKMEKGDLNTGGLPFNPLQAWVIAGLDQFRAAFIATSFETEDAALHLGLTYAEKPALIKIYASKGPGTPPAFIPAEAQELSWGTLDWGGFYDNITQLAISVSPLAAGGIEMGTTELKKKIGVDLRQDILGQMGDALWSTSHNEPVAAKTKGGTASDPDDSNTTPSNASPFSALNFTQGQSQVIGIGLRDAKAFAISLKSIFNTVAPGQALFDDRKFMDITIHQVKNLPAEMKVAWLIHQDTFILSIGRPDLLEKVLAGMAKPPVNSLINEPHVKSAFAKLPDGGDSSGYANAGQMIDVLLGAVKPFLEQQLDGEAASLIGNLPDKLGLQWYFVSRLYLGEQSTDVRLRLSTKP